MWNAARCADPRAGRSHRPQPGRGSGSRKGSTRPGGGGPIRAGCWATRPRASPGPWAPCSSGRQALLWDTYDCGGPLVRLQPGPGGRSACTVSRPAPTGSSYRAGPRADLASWHRVVDPMNRVGFIWINSSGSPKSSRYAGGPGRPADVPGGLPAAVVMIHSFSAADPADPRTIAGRWLAQGAFVYLRVGATSRTSRPSVRPAAGRRNGGRRGAPGRRAATGRGRAVRASLAPDLPGRSALPHPGADRPSDRTINRRPDTAFPRSNGRESRYLTRIGRSSKSPDRNRIPVSVSESPPIRS